MDRVCHLLRFLVLFGETKKRWQGGVDLVYEPVS
ncbi:hypothetical protein Q668_06930 [Alcanivorax sp. PN-3]|nr:hypothetical protein Q668_06930 [Alcanivorax sp. PN-3]